MATQLTQVTFPNGDYIKDTNTTYSLSADTTNNKIKLTPSSGSVQSITVPYATSAGSATSATTASQLAEDISYITSGTSFVVHTTKKTFKTYLSRRNNLGISSATDGMMVLAGTWQSGNYTSELALGMGDNYGIYYRGSNSSAEQAWQEVGRFTATPTSGRVMITDGTEGGMKSSGYTIATSVPSGAVFTDTKNTAGSTDTSSKIFLIGATSQAANPQTYSDNEVYVTNGTLQANNVSASVNVTGVTLGVATTSGTTGGICLYGGATSTTSYGIAMRTTANSGKHGYVQGDWGTYFYMAGATNRGWVFCNAGVGNRASISTEGNMVLNGSLTLGGNTTNTSGVRQIYNSTTKSLDFVFVA